MDTKGSNPAELHDDAIMHLCLRIGLDIRVSGSRCHLNTLELSKHLKKRWKQVKI